MWTLEKLVEAGYTAEQAQQIMDGMGQMVPKSRLDDKIAEVNDYKTQIANYDTQLKDLQTKATGNTELQSEITRLQQENEQAKTDYEGKLAQKDYDFALTDALRDAKAKNPTAVKALLKTDAIQLVDGKLVGLEKQLTALKTSDDYLFAAEGLAGRTPPNTGGGGKPPQALTRAEFAKKTYEERLKLTQENPSLLSELQ